MGKTKQYALASLLIGSIYLLVVTWFPLKIDQTFYCGVKDVQPNYGWCGNAVLDADGIQAQRLFKSNCASCHKLNAQLIGPALDGVEQRWIDAGNYKGISGREWLKRFICNWKDPVEAGHPYALQIVEFDEIAMTQFSHLSDEDIELILKYINPY